MKILKTMLKESNFQTFEWFIVAEDLIVTSVRLQLVGWFIVFNATFNNISVILWQSVLLVEETGVHRENHQPVASHWQSLSHNVVSFTIGSPF